MSDHPVVLGPSADGGFYLIGFVATAYESSVFDQAREAPDQASRLVASWARSRGWTVGRLRRLRDVDTVADLDRVLGDPQVKAPELRRTVEQLRRRTGRSFPILNREVRR